MESLAETNQQLEEVSPETKQKADSVRSELTKVIKTIAQEQQTLESTFVKLGVLLDTVQKEKLWLCWEHRSFNDFIKSIENKVNRGRTTLYHSLRIAKQLLPYMPPEEVEQVGISKASKLAQAVKESGKRPSDLLIEAAKDSKITTEQFESLIADNYGARAEQDLGEYYQLGCLFLHPEEKDEFQRAVSIVCRTDPPFQYDITKWQDASANQKKEILWRLMATYLSTFETEVNGAV